MTACVSIQLMRSPLGETVSLSLYLSLSDGWATVFEADIPLSGSAAVVNAAVKQAAADAVKEQHGVTLDPATEILLVGGAS